jgi:hypothetical protein
LPRIPATKIETLHCPPEKMTSSLYRGMLFLGLSAVLILAQVGDAFVNKQPTTNSLSTKTKLPKLSHLPVNIFFSSDQKQSYSSALMATEPEKSSGGLPFWLDPGTRGGAVVLSLLLFILPFIGYSVATNIFGVDGVDAGKYIGVGFTAVATLLWVFTYIFRVATKDMTYVSTSLSFMLSDISLGNF